MRVDQLKKYAQVMVWGMIKAREEGGGSFEKGDIIQLMIEEDARDLGLETYKELLKRGFHVKVLFVPGPDFEQAMFEFSNDDQLAFVGDWDVQLMENLNGRIVLLAPKSLDHLKDVDPGKISLRGRSFTPLRKLMMQRSVEGELGWTLCMMPTQALADKAGMSLKEYEDQIIKACYLDEVDPVAAWEKIDSQMEEIKKKLFALDIDYYHIKSKNIDLKITLGQDRKWISGSGHNIPSFEIFTSPDWRGVEGVYYADIPSMKDGNLVEGVKLVFKEGRIVDFSAKTGEKFLESQIKMDENSDKVGEFSLTDRRMSQIDRFMANTLFDENFGGKFGNMHIAIGSSYPESYSGERKNDEKLQKELGFNISALHWDLVNGEDKTVTVVLKNGKKKIVYKSGEFVL